MKVIIIETLNGHYDFTYCPKKEYLLSVKNDGGISQF